MAKEKITGIVIDTIKYNDSRNVVTLFTRERGRISFLSSSGNGSKGKIRNARLMPLSVIESAVSFNASRDLQMLGQISAARIRSDIYFNPLKSSVILFLTEFLNKYFRNSPQDPLAFDFVVTAIDYFELLHHGIANFHLYFLKEFLNIAGIYPDLTELEENDLFDMRLGEPVAEKPLHYDYLTKRQTSALPLLFRMNPRNLAKFRFSRNERTEIIEFMLRYYSIHFPGVSNFKSIDILTEIFS